MFFSDPLSDGPHRILIPLFLFLGASQDTQYFSDSEHQLISTSYAQRESRRIRNRTLSGLDSARMLLQQRPASAQGSRAITPSFQNEKENGQNFVDFNPAGEEQCDQRPVSIFLKKSK